MKCNLTYTNIRFHFKGSLAKLQNEFVKHAFSVSQSLAQKRQVRVSPSRRWRVRQERTHSKLLAHGLDSSDVGWDRRVHECKLGLASLDTGTKHNFELIENWSYQISIDWPGLFRQNRRSTECFGGMYRRGFWPAEAVFSEDYLGFFVRKQGFCLKQTR